MTKHLKLFAFFILIFLLASACSASPQKEAAMAPAPQGGMVANDMVLEAPMEEMADGDFIESQAISSGAADSIERLIIRNGNLRIQVDDTYKARDQIKQIVDQLEGSGAFILSANEYGGTETRTPQINMVIRVPADAFDRVMDQIAEMAEVVDSREENSDDVTEEFNDIANRLESLEAARQRLLQIMENADTTEDLLQAEQQLTQRETEIESLKGRQKYLSESARLSRISITLQPYHLLQPIDTSWKPLETIRQAVDDLIEGAKGFVDFLIYFTIAVLPWLALFGYIAYRLVRYFRNRKANKKVADK